eukprot:362965-Chlamydomonas_euryale.AAC.5
MPTAFACSALQTLNPVLGRVPLLHHPLPVSLGKPIAQPRCTDPFLCRCATPLHNSAAQTPPYVVAQTRCTNPVAQTPPRARESVSLLCVPPSHKAKKFGAALNRGWQGAHPPR